MKLQTFEDAKSRLDWLKRGVDVRDLAAINRDCPDRTAYGVWAEKSGLLPVMTLAGGGVRFAIDQGSGKGLAALTEAFGEIQIVDVEKGSLRAANVGVTDKGRLVAWAKVSDAVYDRAIEKREAEPDKSTWVGLPGYFIQALNGLMAISGKMACSLALETDTQVCVWNVRGAQCHIDEAINMADAFVRSVVEAKAPDVDDKRDVLVIETELSEVERLVWGKAESSWLVADNRIKRLEAVLKTMKERKADAAGTLRGIVAGQGRIRGRSNAIQVCAFTKRGAVDWQKVVRKKLPEVDDATVDRFRKASKDDVKVTRL